MVFNNLVGKNHHLEFDIEDVDVSVVNAIRRIIISEVPTVAFDDDLKIIKNTGALHNEFLSHRLCLIPLHFDADKIADYQKLKYHFQLKVKNTTVSMMDVTTADFKITDEDGNAHTKAFHEQIFPKNAITGDHILITKLKPNLFDKTKGDELDIVATATVGTGKMNAKWAPVSLCTYWNVIDEDSAADGLKEYIVAKSSSALSDAELEARFNTLDRYRFFKKNEFGEPNAFHFELDSECHMTPAFIFKKALLVLIEKITSLAKHLTERDSKHITVEQSNGLTFITVNKEDHTLGNIIQAMVYNQHIRNARAVGNELTYIGYYKPHPLEDNVVFKLKTNSEDPVLFLATACMGVCNYLESLVTEWDTVTREKPE